MSKDRLRIFISSPGDVGQERLLARRVVERLQGEFQRWIRLEPILWEHEPLRATAHFQEQIPKPSDADVVVCILWSRLGTRLPAQFTREDGSTYASGTEWEFEDAAEAFRRTGTPDLLVYRKTAEPLTSLSDEEELLRKLEQKKALDQFIDRWFGNPQDSFQAAFHAFGLEAEFETLLESHLRRLVESRLPENASAEDSSPVAVVWRQGSPFRGLSAFDVEHAPVFFGRTRAIVEVRRALERQAAAGRPFVLITGMSGCGKSSLARAGILPNVTTPGVVENIGLWPWAVLRPAECGEDLAAGLAGAILGENALAVLAEEGLRAGELAQQLRENPAGVVTHLRMGLEKMAARVQLTENLPALPNARLFLLIDQMEELFTLDPSDVEAAHAFAGMLEKLVESGLVWCVATLRADFYSRCVELPELLRLKEGDGHYDLLPPELPEIRQMIRLPALAAGLRFEARVESGEQLDDLLLGAAAESPEALPLLEFTLEELYRCREDSLLTFAAYEKLGGLEGALARRAEETLAAMPESARQAFPALMRQLVAVNDERPTARSVALGALDPGGDPRALLDAFVDARLLVVSDAGGEAQVRIAHEALLRHWPRLAAMLEEDRDFLRARGRVESAAERWRQEARAEDFLLREGRPLLEARGLLERRAELNADVAAFIDASVAAVESAQREREALARRKLRQTRLAAAVFGVLALVAILAGVLAARERAEAEIARADAERSAEIARNERDRAASAHAEARRNLGVALFKKAQEKYAAGHFNEAAILAAQAWVEDPRNYYRGLFADSSGLVSLSAVLVAEGNDAPPAGVSGLVAHGERLYSGHYDNVVRAWDWKSGELLQEYRGHGDKVRDIALTPDGRILLSAGYDREVRVWSAADGKLLQQFRKHAERVYTVTVSADGALAASGDSDGTIYVWTPRDGKVMQRLTAHEGIGVMYLGFSPDGRWLVSSGSDNGDLLAWSTRTWEPTAILRATSPWPVKGFRFLDDGKDMMFVAGTGQGDLHRIRIAPEPGEIDTLVRHPGSWLRDVVVTADRRRAVTGGRFGYLSILDLAGKRWETTVLAHDKPIRRLALLGDRQVASAAMDGVIRIWELPPADAGNAPPFSGAQTRVYRLAYDADGDRLAAADAGGTVHLWNGDGQPASDPFPLAGGQAVTDVTFMPGDTLVAIGRNFLAELNLVSGAVRKLKFSDSSPEPVLAVSPRSSRLFVTHNAGLIRARDLASGEARLLGDLERTEVHALALSSDGNLLASSGFDRVIDIWNVESGKPVAHLEGHGFSVRSLAFLPDGRVMSGSSDRTVRIWNTRTGSVEKVLDGHTRKVEAVAASMRGRYIASGGDDQTVRVWDAATGAVAFVLHGPPSSVTSLVFGATDSILFSAHANGEVRRWDLDQIASDPQWHLRETMRRTGLTVEAVSVRLLEPAEWDASGP